MNKDSCINLSW